MILDAWNFLQRIVARSEADDFFTSWSSLALGKHPEMLQNLQKYLAAVARLAESNWAFSWVRKVDYLNEILDFDKSNNIAYMC